MRNDDLKLIRLNDFIEYSINGGKEIPGTVTKITKKYIVVNNIYNFRKEDGILAGLDYGAIRSFKPSITLERLIEDDRILAIYPYGSQIYETMSDNSDLDYIVITTEDFKIDENHATTYDVKLERNLDFNFYNEDKWSEMCISNHICTLEIRSIIKDGLSIKNNKNFEINIDVIKVRQSISSVVSNAWAKAHKKLTVEKDYSPYTAKKSLWHCFRILMFGIQVYKYGGIVDFTEANSIYNEIVNNDCNDWAYYKGKYQGQLNNLRTEFRKFSEKEWDKFKNS